MIKTIELDLAEDSLEGKLLKHLESTGQLEKFILTSLKDLANKNKKPNHKEISYKDEVETHSDSSSQNTVSLEVMKISMDALTDAMDKVCAIANKAMDMASLYPTSTLPLSRQFESGQSVEESSVVSTKALAVEESKVETFEEPDVEDFFSEKELADMKREDKEDKEDKEDIVIDDDLEDFFGDMEIEEKPMQVTQRLSMAEVLEKNRQMTVE